MRRKPGPGSAGSGWGAGRAERWGTEAGGRLSVVDVGGVQCCRGALGAPCMRGSLQWQHEALAGCLTSSLVPSFLTPASQLAAGTPPALPVLEGHRNRVTPVDSSFIEARCGAPLPLLRTAKACVGAFALRNAPLPPPPPRRRRRPPCAAPRAQHCLPAVQMGASASRPEPPAHHSLNCRVPTTVEFINETEHTVQTVRPAAARAPAPSLLLPPAASYCASAAAPTCPLLLPCRRCGSTTVGRGACTSRWRPAPTCGSQPFRATPGGSSRPTRCRAGRCSS